VLVSFVPFAHTTDVTPTLSCCDPIVRNPLHTIATKRGDRGCPAWRSAWQGTICCVDVLLTPGAE